MVKTLQRIRFVNQCTRGTWHSLRAEWRKCSTCGIICDAGGLQGTCTLCIFLGVNRYADRHRFLASCLVALSVLRLLLHYGWSQFFFLAVSFASVSCARMKAQVQISPLASEIGFNRANLKPWECVTKVLHDVAACFDTEDSPHALWLVEEAWTR